MQQGLAHINTALTTCRSIGDKVVGELSTLRGNFTGSTSEGYQSAMTVWVGDYEQVVNALITMQNILEENTQGYSTNDNVQQQATETLASVLRASGVGSR
jgi:WXG100 family type VII secretion target